MKTICDVADRRRQVGGERQALFVPVAADQLLEARLVDRHLARVAASRTFGCVLVDADDVVAVLGEAGAGDQADVPVPTTAIFIRSAVKTPVAYVSYRL